MDLRHNAINLPGLEGLVSFLQNSMGLGSIVGASLSEERGRTLVPYINIKTVTKTLALDLRHNLLFSAETSASEKRSEKALSAFNLRCGHACSSLCYTVLLVVLLSQN